MKRRNFLSNSFLFSAPFVATNTSAGIQIRPSQEMQINSQYKLLFSSLASEKLMQKIKSRLANFEDAEECSLVFDKFTKLASIADGATLELEDGNYPINRSINLVNNSVVTGQSNGSTRIHPYGDFNAFVCDATLYQKNIGRAGIKQLMINFITNVNQQYTKGNGITVMAGNKKGQSVWKPFVQDVQMYQVPNAGISLKGTINSAVAETYLRNIEIGKCKYGLLDESYYVYDTYCDFLYIDSATQFGVSILGGSNTFIHTHAVSCGKAISENKSIGGGFNIRTNNNSFYDCHADGCYSDGFVVGGFDITEGPMSNNRFTSCMAFNNGAGLIKSVAGFRIGKVRQTKLIGCFAGKIGNGFTLGSNYGYLLESNDIQNLKLIGCSAKDSLISGYAISNISAEAGVQLIGCDYEGGGKFFTKPDHVKQTDFLI